MHNWGDEDFDWNGLYEAELYINKIMKLARIGVHSKEKYGTLRLTPYFFDGTIHHILYPGFVYCQYKLLREQRWYLDIYFWPKVFYYTGITWVVSRIQAKVYGLAYYLTVKKFPHLEKEICSDSDYPELIPGWKDVYTYE
jgi:hypothetical protein